jgi:hypothetical protein
VVNQLQLMPVHDCLRKNFVKYIIYKTI